MTLLFYLLLGLMAAVAAAAAIIPLLGTVKKSASRRQQNIRAAKEQLAALTVLPPAAAQDLREDVARQLLDNAAPDDDGGRGGGKWLAFVIAAILPLSAAGLYWRLGAPDAASPSAGITAASLERAVDALQQELKDDTNNADNADKWRLLARSLATLERYGEARAAFAHLREIVGESAEILISEAEMAMGENKTEAAAALLDRALALHPDNGAALWLAGRLAAARDDAVAAGNYWRRALPLLADFPEEQAVLATMIDELETPPAATVVAHIRLPDSVRDKVGDAAAVFVFAHAAEEDAGGGPPLAVKRLNVGDLPAMVTLDDSDAMMPNLNLSTAARFVVIARVSPSGGARGRGGDFYGKTAATMNGATVSIVINQPWQPSAGAN